MNYSTFLLYVSFKHIFSILIQLLFILLMDLLVNKNNYQIDHNTIKMISNFFKKIVNDQILPDSVSTHSTTNKLNTKTS